MEEKRNISMSGGARRRRRKKRPVVTEESIIGELAVIAFADMGDIIELRDGVVCVKEIDDIPEGARHAAAYIKSGTKGDDIKLYDKMKALELLGKYLGLFGGKGGGNAFEELDRVIAELDAECGVGSG